MQRSKAQVEADLDKLGPHDFDSRNRSADGMERLYVLLPELVAVAAPGEAAVTILKLIERLSDTPNPGVYELGNPGPMVHELERLAGYEAELVRSVARFPTPLTVWMVNRIMNVLDKHDDRWARLLELLKQAAAAVNAAPDAREAARHYIGYQEAG